MRKYKRASDEKIVKGLKLMHIFIKKKMFCYIKQFAFEKKEEAFYVEESQIELLNALKGKNIHSMSELKKYIVCSIKNNKFELF